MKYCTNRDAFCFSDVYKKRNTILALLILCFWPYLCIKVANYMPRATNQGRRKLWWIIKVVLLSIRRIFSIYLFSMDLNKHEVDVHYYMSYSDAFFHWISSYVLKKYFTYISLTDIHSWISFNLFLFIFTNYSFPVRNNFIIWLITFAMTFCVFLVEYFHISFF